MSIYNKLTGMLGMLMLTWGLSALIPNGLWLYLAMAIVGTALITREIVLE